MHGADKRLLLNLARESIRTYFSGKKPDLTHVRKFSERQGVFVSLHDRTGRLRGCVGYPGPNQPLYVGIVEAARNAAFHDSRFPPLKEDELSDIAIEVSVLTKPELLHVDHYNYYPRNINIGTDGLIIEHPQGTGLLLPQVALENNLNAQSFLNAVAQKAGLSFNAWKDQGVKIYRFRAEIFSENS